MAQKLVSCVATRTADAFFSLNGVSSARPELGTSNRLMSSMMDLSRDSGTASRIAFCRGTGIMSTLGAALVVCVPWPRMPTPV